MSDLYLDEIEKIKFYKQRLVSEYLKEGVPVNKEKIQERLDNIDVKLAIFSQGYIKSGETFSVEKFNEQKQDIYRDLTILYYILYELVKKRITTAEARIDFSLNALLTEAKQFQYLVDSQAVSVYGKTVFHQASDFNQEYKNGQVIISLGSVTVSPGSYLACLFQCNELDISQVSFRFDDNTIASPYTYNYQYLPILNNYSTEIKSYDTNDKIVGKNLIEMQEEADTNHEYNILLNHNQISIHYLDGIREFKYANKIKQTYYQCPERSEIIFYVYGASYIKFDTIGEIEYANFSDNQIMVPKQRQKIIIKARAGFSFDIDTDGEIYAELAHAEVFNGKLKLAKNYENITDYAIEIITYGEDVVFDDVKVIIDNATSTFYDINYIAIKQTRIMELENDYL